MNLFKITDKNIFKKLGKISYLYNGVGYGFINNNYLYDNCLLQIGFGKVISGIGDWGFGFDRVSDTPLKIIIDKNMIIKKTETSFFYNSNGTQKIEKVVGKILKRLKPETKFIIKDEKLKYHVQKVFDFLPCKAHIGYDVFESPHMLEYFIKPENKNHYNLLREPSG